MDKFLVKVRYDEKYKNINLLIKDMLNFTQSIAAEDLCLRDMYTGDYILDGELLIADNIYRVTRAENHPPLNRFRNTIMRKQNMELYKHKDHNELNRIRQ